MVPNKSLDNGDESIIAALLLDVSDNHGSVFNTRNCRLTTQVACRRLRLEGRGFLTKTLPKLGKCLDKALTGSTKLFKSQHGFATMKGSELPRFLGEFFSRVFQSDGTLLPDPCVTSIRVLRDFLYLFYKYEDPYTDEQEQQVIQKFVKTEDDISTHSAVLDKIKNDLMTHTAVRHQFSDNSQIAVTRRARVLLRELFRGFDPKQIVPRHGPGSVATKQQLWEKYQWTNVSANITNMYPLDEYFYSSLSHVCDRLDSFNAINQEDLPARVILVPKDSRGPRLISCEPVDYQWIQQGLGRSIVDWVERHRLTKFNVNFTDQGPNQRGALLGSINGRYATLDLNEASDRVSLSLVRLLFPEELCSYLEACRSSSTVLPDGRVLKLNKFAPMGSCLCFPILALTVWAILTASSPDADARESILVYGDDVIVPTAQAESAIEQLESFGLKVNRDKSCTSGFFRESCGTDAFKGVNVTPVRLRTVWSSVHSPDVYTSWIAYANSFYDRRCYRTYDLIVSRLVRIYRTVPDESFPPGMPRLRVTPDHAKPNKRRYNPNLQRLEYNVLTVKSPLVTKDIDGWSMLLRYHVEAQGSSVPADGNGIHDGCGLDIDPVPSFSVRSYTRRRTSMLVRRWR